MADWAVIFSPAFKATLATTRTEFEKRLDQAQSRSAVENVLRQYEPFDKFASLALDLRDGISRPSELLSYYGKSENGNPLYLLNSGGWCGLFSADDSKRICTGIKVYDSSEVPLLKRLKGTVQSPFRRHFQ
jgi:hypothetical protein